MTNLISTKVDNKRKIVYVSGKLAKEFLLAVHMIRSPKHIDIFKIENTVEFSKPKVIKVNVIVKEKILGSNSEITMYLGDGYIVFVSRHDSRIKVAYKILKDEETGKLYYIRYTNIVLQPVNLITITSDPLSRYTGYITPTTTVMIQNQQDQGKISFRSKKFRYNKHKRKAMRN